jgi:hypothetical protein
LTDEKFFTIEEQYNSRNNNICAQKSLEVHSEGAGMPSPFLRHGLVGDVPSGGDTSSFLQERGETGARMHQEDVLQGVVKQLNITLFSGQGLVFHQDSLSAQKPRRSMSGCAGTFRPLSAPRICPRGDRTSNPWTLNCVLFWRTKASQQPGQSGETPLESNGRDPAGDGACSDRRVAGASQGLRRGIGRPF